MCFSIALFGFLMKLPVIHVESTDWAADISNSGGLDVSPCAAAGETILLVLAVPRRQRTAQTQSMCLSQLLLLLLLMGSQTSAAKLLWHDLAGLRARQACK